MANLQLGVLTARVFRNPAMSFAGQNQTYVSLLTVASEQHPDLSYLEQAWAVSCRIIP